MSIISAASTTTPVQTPRDRVFALPEICERISYSLDRATITTCSRVNRAWNASWLPILWHTIDAGRHWALPSFQDALGRHGDLIHILKCVRYDDISPLLNTDSALCTNLVTLSLPKTTMGNQRDHARLLQQNPQIRDLSLAIHDDPSSHYKDLVDAVGELRFLRRLALDTNRTLEPSTLETILTRCNSSLKELTLRDSSFLKHPFGSGMEFASGLLSISDTAFEAPSMDVEIDTKVSFGILSLYMDGVACTQDLPLNLGSRFPLLNRLSLSKTNEVYFTEDFPARLATRCPKIKHLNISSTEDLDDATIAQMIIPFPGLQTLQASETQFSNKSLATLVDMCKDLTVLDIASTSGVQGQLFQRLFERCSGLRDVSVWGIHMNVAEMLVEAFGSRTSANGAVLRAGHFYQHDVQGQWACRGLESLAIYFDYDSTELTEDEQRLYPPSRARRFIYEQLSKLTKLKYLAIAASLLDVDDEDDYEDEGGEEDEGIHEHSGTEKDATAETRAVASELTVDDPSQTRQDEQGTEMMREEDESDNSLWIDCSLRSGLASLAPLKDLRSLCLDAAVHGVGVPEMEWMSRNWPNLKVIAGLDEDDHEEVIVWLQENRPNIEIDDGS
ncbi:hypothetical protein EDD21DRAFT_380572, partial [Dissophora ornata]